MMFSFRHSLCLLLLLCCLCAGCHPDKKGNAPASTSAVVADVDIAVHFEEVAEKVGITFQHNNGAKGKKRMPETVGSGVAFLDYDNDGYQDILIVNSCHWPDDKGSRSTPHLYHNNGNGTFTDVTKEAGLDIELYGMGVAIGDYDNDGYEDIFITAIGANHLFHNEGKATPHFKDVTLPAGVQGVPMPGTELQWKWSASAAWVDYDRDGKLDLFVCQYVQWSPTRDRFCGHNGIRGYCPPGTFEGAYCTLYHNEGSFRPPTPHSGGAGNQATEVPPKLGARGRHPTPDTRSSTPVFRDVSDEMGIRKGPVGKSFGIAIADYNGDGWPDIAVSNDTWANFLYINEGGKRFVERGVECGMAAGENGHFKAGMGIDTGDWRNNGQFALLIGNFAGEGLSLYENEGNLLFADHAHQSGIAEPSLTFLTFGLFFFDYDLDGWQDVFAANGHVDDVVSTYNSMLSFKERPLLFHNGRKGSFQDATTACGLEQKVVGRGAAFGDMDNDGDVDIALVDNGGRFLLFRNEGGNRNHWVVFRTEGTKSNRDGIGAIIRVKRNGVTQSQYVRSGGSFLSENQRSVTFGLGSGETVESVEVLWPSGQVDRSGPLPANQHYLITEGQGFQKDPRLSH